MISLLKYSIAALLLLICFFSIGRERNNICIKCVENEPSLMHLIDSAKKSNNDSLSLQLHQRMQNRLNDELTSGSSFNYPFDSLRNIGKVYAPDKSFRIFTWNAALSDITYKYYGIIQINPGKDSVCKTFMLIDKSASFKGELEDARFSSGSWYGTLYYDIIQQKIGNQTIYALLGLHLKDMFSNVKVVESMYFADNGRPMFGTPVFQFKNKILNRLVFEYSIYVKMGLVYDSDKKMIVFDHLAPSEPIHTGNFMYYGPDFSYDGLRFENNKWILYSNIDARQPKSKEHKRPLPKPPAN